MRVPTAIPPRHTLCTNIRPPGPLSSQSALGRLFTQANSPVIAHQLAASMLSIGYLRWALSMAKSLRGNRLGETGKVYKISIDFNSERLYASSTRLQSLLVEKRLALSGAGSSSLYPLGCELSDPTSRSKLGKSWSASRRGSHGV